jgi:hypothetical protein
MRALQFWILLLGSSFVSFLFITQIFLTRSLIQEQRVLAESRETVSQGAEYENVWHQLATRIYQAGNQDPALADILKKENIAVHPNASTSAGSAPAPPASTQTPVAPPRPVAP